MNESQVVGSLGGENESAMCEHYVGHCNRTTARYPRRGKPDVAAGFPGQRRHLGRACSFGSRILASATCGWPCVIRTAPLFSSWTVGLAGVQASQRLLLPTTL